MDASNTPYTNSSAEFSDLREQGVARERSLFHATRSSLSQDTRSTKAGHVDKPTLLRRLPDAKMALRYEAVLDVFTHMGKAVEVREHHDYASAGHPTVFAVVRPLSDGSLDIGVALASIEDELLLPCLGEWPHPTIQSKFTLDNNEPLAGKHLRFIRLASRAVNKS